MKTLALTLVAFASLVFIPVLGSPAPAPVVGPLPEVEARSASSCVTVASGTLATSDVAIGWPYGKKKRVLSPHPFALNSDNEITFYNTTKPTIFAEFQKCTPNYYGANNDGSLHNFDIQYWGRVYVPATQQCIGIENPNDYTLFLYYPKLVPCLNSAAGQMSTSASIPQNFAYRNDNGRHLVYWAGSSTGSPPTYQGYCETGLLGYFQWLPNGYPRVGTNNRIEYVCNADDENAVTAAELI